MVKRADFVVIRCYNIKEIHKMPTEHKKSGSKSPTIDSKKEEKTKAVSYAEFECRNIHIQTDREIERWSSIESYN